MTIPFAYALRESLKGGYSLHKFRQDVLAGLIVALVALPLSMALAIAVGLPPQHGIYTAIVAGILTPLLGGSAMQVSGPTAAFVVIVAPMVAEHGLRGLMLAELMAGIFLMLLAAAKLGRFINFVPYPVTTGFTAGIAVVLGTLALSDLLGLGADITHGTFIEKISALYAHISALRWQEALVGITSLAIMLKGKSITQKIPATILGMAAGTALSLALAQGWGADIATIGSRFSYDTPHGVAHGIPPYPPSLHWFSGEGLFAAPTWSELRVLFMPAIVIAALAALESLLSATVADGMSRTRHEPNAELAAIGVANIFSALAAGIPATGAIARTTTNIKSGACSPLASAMHGLFILLFIIFLAPWLSYLPMAALAALLVVTAYNMSHYRQFFRILRIAHKQDVLVLLTCFGLTVFVDMVAGVTVGIILSALLFIQRMAAATEAYASPVEGTGEDNIAVPPGVMIYRINGPLFFASVERAIDRTAFLRNGIKTLVLDMEHVPLIDMTGLVTMKDLLTSESLKDKETIICAAPDIADKIRKKLGDSPNLRVRFAPSVDSGLAMAEV